MIAQPPLWLILLAFFGAIGPLVFFHELGHYGVARLFGIGAETFSIGFGREIAGWTDRLGTRWKIGWLPFGGYVRFTGDLDAANQPGDADLLSEAERARSFQLRPVWQRFLVVLAGPMANFLLAIVLIAGLIAWYGQQRSPNLITVVSPGSAAASIGLRPGDRILSIDGTPTPYFEDIDDATKLKGGEPVTIRFHTPTSASDVVRTTIIKSVVQHDPFGQPFERGLLGVGSNQIVSVRVSILDLIPRATVAMIGQAGTMIKGLAQVVRGTRSTNELGGPLKMAQMAGQWASFGGGSFVSVVAIFSINLGFINLLPVPMLDGGHLALYTIEAVRRRPIGERAQEWVFRGGLALLLTLLLFVTAKDLGSFGLWSGLGRLIG